MIRLMGILALLADHVEPRIDVFAWACQLAGKLVVRTFRCVSQWLNSMHHSHASLMEHFDNMKMCHGYTGTA